MTVSDDVAILTLASPIYANGGNIQYAKLPNGADLFVGQTGFISGWGRTNRELLGFYICLISASVLIYYDEPQTTGCTNCSDTVND